MMKKRDALYGALVNRIPGIRQRYADKRKQAKGMWGRIGAWLYLVGINIAYYLFRIEKLRYPKQYPYYEKKRLYGKDSESSLSQKESPKELAERLTACDVISFDVFDTLIFRPFSSPADLFYLVGNELEYLDFQRIRTEAEDGAREKKYKEKNSREVTLDEIYTLLSKETGLKKEEAMSKEAELEKALCFANPYMKTVVEALREKGKRLIVTSDMYLGEERIREMLKACGYPEFAAYYVSCDVQKSKSRGDLYAYVKEKEGAYLSFAHVGDHPKSDIENAKKHGFDTFYYENVNTAGERFRPYDMSVLTGSVYRGIVNAHIHNGFCRFSREYEYGYLYGGLFVAGYCGFIRKYVKQNKTDRILFLARDGYVLMKAYKRLYPDDAEICKYAYWSRLAAVKMSASRYKYDYFRRFLYHKVNQNYSVRQILKAMELEDMAGEVCKHTGLTEETILTEKNAERLKHCLSEHWEQVLFHYEEQLKAGKQYYEELLQHAKTAVAVDIGWAGSGAVMLHDLVKRVWKLDCEITGILAGTNTCHNAEPNAAETFLQSKRLVSYLYSQRENRDLWKLHDAGKEHNLYWELLLDAPEGSLQGFYLNPKGEWEIRLKPLKTETKGIREVQRGVLDFVEQYREWMKKMPLLEDVSGRDAYAPMVNVLAGKNRKFTDGIRKLMDSAEVG